MEPSVVGGGSAGYYEAQALIAVAAAEKSFSATIRALPAHERQRILAEVSAGIAANRSAFAATIVAEAGKPLRAALTEVDRAVFTFRVAAEEAVRQGGEVLPLDLLPGTEGRWGMMRRFPIGPVLAITPFNFPLNLVAHKLAPAIAAGCPVVLKPAPQTPLERSGAREADYRGGMAAGGSLRAADGQRGRATADRGRRAAFECSVLPAVRGSGGI